MTQHNAVKTTLAVATTHAVYFLSPLIPGSPRSLKTSTPVQCHLESASDSRAPSGLLRRTE